MIDESATIQAHLLDRPELVALTDTRIFAEADTPPAGYKPSDGPAICFKRRGGKLSDYEAVNFFPSYQFKCYGAMGADFQAISPQQSAMTVYRALWDVLNYHFGYLIKSAELEVPGQTLLEPDTKWVYILCFYKLQILNP